MYVFLLLTPIQENGVKEEGEGQGEGAPDSSPQVQPDAVSQTHCIWVHRLALHYALTHSVSLLLCDSPHLFCLLYCFMDYKFSSHPVV